MDSNILKRGYMPEPKVVLPMQDLHSPLDGWMAAMRITKSDNTGPI
jgi:hypothetical protein